MMKSWKSLALLSLLSALNGVEAHTARKLRRGLVEEDSFEHEAPPAVVVNPENVENTNWFVDKEGRALQSGVRPLSELIAQTFVCQFTEAALVTSGLANVLNGDGPFTMMIPWDYEWKRQPYVNKFKTGPWRAHLRNMLMYYIHEGNLPEDALPSTKTIYMMNGESMDLTFDGSRSRVEGFRNIGTTPVENGYVYLLQNVIKPSFLDRNLYQIVNSDHSIFASLLVATGEHTQLENTAESVGFTVFAPTNAAFNKVSPGFVNYLNTNSGTQRQDRLNLCRYHIARPVTPSMNMNPGSNMKLTTLQGQQLTVRMENDVLTVTAAQSVATATNMDKLAYNGIVHVVDEVLLLKNFNSIPSPSPTNVGQHIQNEVSKVSGLDSGAFNNNNSYQSKARSWVISNCSNCGTDGARIMQRYALACIYYATHQIRNPISDRENSNGFRWSSRSGWPTNSGDTNDECNWYGISCNDQGYVSSIVLRENMLSGQFPKETKLLKDSLEILDLTKNYMYNDGSDGNDWLGDLRKLKYLSLRQTGFSYDGIPPAIGFLTELTDLDVSYCLYFGQLRSSVFNNLDKVTYLDISGNSYTNAAPSSIGSMSSLLYFYAIETNLRGNLNFIMGATKLQELWIDDNSAVTGSIPTLIGRLDSLVSLSLSDNNLQGQIPTQLGDCQLLKQVWLYGNRLSGSVPTHIGRLDLLERFEIFENNISNGSMPNQVCQLPNLDALTADCSEISCSNSCCSCCSNCRRFIE